MPQISQRSPYLRPTLDHMVTPREQQRNDCPALQSDKINAFKSTTGTTSSIFLQDIPSFCSSSELFLQSIIWQARYGLLGALPWVWQSVSSFRDLPPRRRRRNLKMWFQALEFAVSCTVANYIFYCCRRKGARTSINALVFLKNSSRAPVRRQSKHAPHNSIFSLDAHADT